MKADKICAYEKGKVRLESCEVKPPGENEVLIKTLFSTISPGTELAWLNHMENTPGEYPYYPGYSCCGPKAPDTVHPWTSGLNGYSS